MIVAPLVGHDPYKGITMHDSGQRETFSTGSVRDVADDKPRPELISPIATLRLAMWYARGAKKYNDRNWEKGQPYSRVTASLYRHLLSWMMGKTDEDHLAAVAWNAFAIMHYQDQVARGNLPASLDDMPNYSLNLGYGSKSADQPEDPKPQVDDLPNAECSKAVRRAEQLLRDMQPHKTNYPYSGQPVRSAPAGYDRT